MKGGDFRDSAAAADRDALARLRWEARQLPNED